jgi:quinol monooxygenase YgiN
MYVVTVEFEIKPEHLEPFMKEMLANARASVEKEPGCKQFDVCADPADRRRVFLYELYTDRAAFDAHLAAGHFKAFDRTVGGWIAAKTVKTWQRVD